MDNVKDKRIDEMNKLNIDVNEVLLNQARVKKWVYQGLYSWVGFKAKEIPYISNV